MKRICSLLIAMVFIAVAQVSYSKSDSKAISTLRTINTECEIFRAGQLPMTYPPNLKALSEAKDPYVDQETGNGKKNGYIFTYTLIGANKYTCVATPEKPGVSGNKTYFVDESGVIRLNNSIGAPAEEDKTMDIGFEDSVSLLLFLWPFFLPAIFLVLNRNFIDRKGIFFLVGTGICWGINMVSIVFIGFIGYFFAPRSGEHPGEIPYSVPLALLVQIIPVVLAIIAMVVVTGKFRRGRQST